MPSTLELDAVRGRRLRAGSADLPAAVGAALAAPSEPATSVVEAIGLRWALASWGDAPNPPLLLVHGVTSDSGIWWRVGPALAAAGRRVVAVDLPGHGRTGGWQGRHRFAETAADLATLIRTAGLDRPDLVVLGHSWGAMVTAHLPGAGIRPAGLILLDPPARTRVELEPMTDDPTERPYATLAEAIAAVREAYPGWSARDVETKAEGLTRFEPEAVLAILLENGTWDAGLAALRRQDSARLPVWLIRGEWSAGGLIPEDKVPGIVGQLGPERVITIPGAPHSPQRTHPEATVAAILLALGELHPEPATGP